MAPIERFIGKRFDQVLVSAELFRPNGEFVFIATADDHHGWRVMAVRRVDFASNSMPLT